MDEYFFFLLTASPAIAIFVLAIFYPYVGFVLSGLWVVIAHFLIEDSGSGGLALLPLVMLAWICLCATGIMALVHFIKSMVKKYKASR